jgi:hypothetical protein
MPKKSALESALKSSMSVQKPTARQELISANAALLKIGKSIELSIMRFLMEAQHKTKKRRGSYRERRS